MASPIGQAQNRRPAGRTARWLRRRGGLYIAGSRSTSSRASRIALTQTSCVKGGTHSIERIHPIREGRSPQQIGRKGLSNHRWIVGWKLCLLLNQYGLVVGWDCATAHVPDQTFQWLIRQVDGRMIVLLRRDS